MEILIIGLILFLGVHLIPTKAGLRQILVSRLGEGPYKGLFSLVSLLGLYLIITGKTQSPMISVWEPSNWSRWVTLVVMLVSIILVAATYVPGNFKRLTAHPMLWGVVIWAGAHLLSNGDLASIILFGGFCVFAIYSLIAVSKRDTAVSKVSHHWLKDASVVTLGTLAYASILFVHMDMLGRPMLP